MEAQQALGPAAPRTDDYLLRRWHRRAASYQLWPRPAKIVSSQLTVGSEQFGEFNRSHVDDLRSRLVVRPHAVTLGGHPFLDAGYQQFLLSVDSYDPSQHREFRELIEGQLRLEIRYESIYGREGFTVVYEPRRLISSPPG
jgi:hypothetical protein